MADFDRTEGELHIKVLYAGPSGSGKSTSVQVLAREAAKHGRAVGNLPIAHDRSGREHLQLCLGRVFGRYTAYVHVVTWPDSGSEPADRHLVRSCDAVVFVADGNPLRAADNVRALATLEADLKREGRDAQTLPIVVQWNKRDQAGPAGASTRAALAAGRPVVESVATRAEGVIATFQRVCLPAIRQAGDAHGISTRSVKRPSATPAPVAAEGTRLTRFFDRARSLFKHDRKAAS